MELNKHTINNIQGECNGLLELCLSGAAVAWLLAGFPSLAVTNYYVRLSSYVIFNIILHFVFAICCWLTTKLNLIMMTLK